jgi:D-tyrosyl-tRNA(Tyr) deacylase
MKVVIQRVLESSVSIEGQVHSQIDNGLLILLGIAAEDTKDDAEWLVSKIIGLRIFSDKEYKMNLSIDDINGSYLVISQFTLHASTKKGNRPSYTKAARPEIAIPLYEYFVTLLMEKSGKNVKTGIFAADMKVSLINDGPVTIIIDTKNKE